MNVLIYIHRERESKCYFPIVQRLVLVLAISPLVLSTQAGAVSLRSK